MENYRNMNDPSNREQISISSKPDDSEPSTDAGDSQHSQLHNVINFYLKIPDTEKDYECKKFPLGDSIYFPSTEANKVTDSLNDDYYKEIHEDMLDWETYMYCKENEERKQSFNQTYADIPIRNKDGSNVLIQYLSKNHRHNIHNNSYIDLSESQYGFKEDWNLEIDEKKRSRRERLALEQKAIGNSYYRDKKYHEAIEFYTKSLNLLPTTEAFNNRAMSYIKLKKFSAAVRDTNEVLRIEPNNQKALYRRSVARKEMRMYEEALIDIHSGMVSNRKIFLNVRNDIKNEMSKLNGKKYTICPQTGPRRTFEIDISQLMVYANCDETYLLEVDKTGCTRSCVCGYCTEENRKIRNKSSALRIKDRERWKVLTTRLLNEMKVIETSANEFNDFETTAVSELSSNILLDNSYNIHRQTSPR